ncbi:MAG: prepilin-type N-terminal cleavage/methylation domain-containing protein [Gemmatimonadales bacterium]
MGPRRGFTLVELVVALALAGVVAALTYRMLLHARLLHEWQAERVELNTSLRTASLMLPPELRELNATDSIESDILVMSPDSIVYKAMRSRYLGCRPPIVSSAASGSVTLRGDLSYGLRALDADRDAVLIFAQQDAWDRGLWIHADVEREPVGGNDCPGGSPSISVSLTGVRPMGSLVRVRAGAPVRGYETVTLRSYRDSRGDWWLGQRTLSKVSGWSRTQPVLGPLAARGLELGYYTAGGGRARAPGEVTRIALILVGQSRVRVGRPGETRSYLADTIVAHAALRNNRR